MSSVKRAFRFRFYPDREQVLLLERTFGCVRFVWNSALDYRTGAWYERQERISYGASSANLTVLKREPDKTWLNEVSSVPLQQALRHQQTAFSNFFTGRARYPKFKAKHRGTDSAEYTTSAFRWDPIQCNLTLAKMTNPLNIRWSRKLPAEPSTVTITRDPSGRWHVSILVDDPNLPDVLPRTDSMVGIDLGINSLATLSTGEKITNRRHLDASLVKLAKAQRILARKQKGSNNRYKAARKVARIHARIADQRRDHLHKLTTRLIRENQTVVIEDLSVSSMVHDRRLSRAISDAAWGELRRQLTYKAEWYGRDLVVIDRWFPSTKRCSDCGWMNESLTLKDRTWSCKCGSIHDRDHNAAINILAAGLAVQACGDGVRPSRRDVEMATVRETGNPNE